MSLFQRETSKGTLSAEKVSRYGGRLYLSLNGERAASEKPWPLPSKMREALPDKFTHVVGKFPLTSEEMGIYEEAVENADGPTEAEKALWKVEKQLDDAERLYQKDPVSAIKPRKEARKALQRWEERYPEAAAKRQERIESERAEREAARKKRYENSFVARRLD